MVKILFHGNKSNKKYVGYGFIIVLYFLFAILMIVLGAFSLKNNKDPSDAKQNSEYYECIEKEKIKSEE